MLVLFFTPVGYVWQCAAFVLFRFFDIVKPQPIRYFDRKLKSGVSADFAADQLLNTLYGLRVNSRDARSVKQLAEIVKFTVGSLK
jgi:phosphatidylglycerophosphatase A